MPPQTIPGRLARLQLSVDGEAWADFGGIVDVAMSISVSELETTTHASNGQRSYIPGLSDFALSVAAQHIDLDPGQSIIHDTVDTKQPVHFKYYLLNAPGRPAWRGMCFMRSGSLAGPLNDAGKFNTTLRCSRVYRDRMPELIEPIVIPEVELVELPIPFLYYPFDGDLLNYGSAPGQDAAFMGTGGSFVAGSMTGKQAVSLTSASSLRIGGGLCPLPGTGDFTLSAHIKITSAGGQCILLSVHRAANGRGVELYGFDTTGGGRSNAYAMSDPTAGAAYDISGNLGNGVGLADAPAWNTSQMIFDRLDTELAYAAVDGVIGPDTSDISAAGGFDVFQSLFGSAIAYIGARHDTFSDVILAVELAEWAWFTEKLSAPQCATIKQLQVQNTLLKDYLGL